VNIQLTQADQARVEEFSGRLFMAGLAAMELAAIDVGVRLGLYTRLLDTSWATPAELAKATGIHARYAREWVEQQAAAGILEVDDASKPPEERRYSLPPAHAHVLLEDTSMAYMAPMAHLVRVIGRTQEQVERAFLSGRGVPYEAYDIHETQAGFTKPTFSHHLAQTWMPALPDIHARLQAGTARVAEIGSGCGWASIVMARAFPGVTVHGWDTDTASVEAARRNAAAAGVSDRVTFDDTDVTQANVQGGYDLVFAVEMLHDVPDPVGVLRAMRRLRGPDGAVLVVDEKAQERFIAPADELERFFYAASVLHCLPVGMASGRSAGTGTVFRPDTLRRYAHEAGFARVEILPVDHPQFRLYRLFE
jgi:2-polyprenyl-3-methyl-5-hydroxy-6-metoxy-1,4-benzoquinol methylase